MIKMDRKRCKESRGKKDKDVLAVAASHWLIPYGNRAKREWRKIGRVGFQEGGFDRSCGTTKQKESPLRQYFDLLKMDPILKSSTPSPLSPITCTLTMLCATVEWFMKQCEVG